MHIYTIHNWIPLQLHGSSLQLRYSRNGVTILYDTSALLVQPFSEQLSVRARLTTDVRVPVLTRYTVQHRTNLNTLPCFDNTKNLSAILDCSLDTQNLNFGKFCSRRISLKIKIKLKIQERAQTILADQFLPVFLKQTPW